MGGSSVCDSDWAWGSRLATGTSTPANAQGGAAALPPCRPPHIVATALYYCISIAQQALRDLQEGHAQHFHVKVGRFQLCKLGAADGYTVCYLQQEAGCGHDES